MHCAAKPVLPARQRHGGFPPASLVRGSSQQRCLAGPRRRRSINRSDSRDTCAPHRQQRSGNDADQAAEVLTAAAIYPGHSPARSPGYRPPDPARSRCWGAATASAAHVKIICRDTQGNASRIERRRVADRKLVPAGSLESDLQISRPTATAAAARAALDCASSSPCARILSRLPRAGAPDRAAPHRSHWRESFYCREILLSASPLIRRHLLRAVTARRPPPAWADLLRACCRLCRLHGSRHRVGQQSSAR